jgi:hypothetical protein
VTRPDALSAIAEWRKEWRLELSALLQECHEPHVLSDMPGNVGDQFITGGGNAVLSFAGVEPIPVSVRAISSVEETSSTLIIPGSGAMHHFFHEWMPATIERASNSFQQILVLPSSFDLTVAGVRRVVARPNVVCIVRDSFSWRSMREVPGASLGPDMALFHPLLTEPIPRPGDRSELLALRTDQGSSARRTPWRPAARNRDISAHGTTESFLAAIDDVDGVVTDRLHVALVAALRGRRVQYVDPYDDKITTTAEVTLGDVGSTLLERRSMQWLVDRGDLVWDETVSSGHDDLSPSVIAT